MASGSEWRKHFEKVSKSKQARLKKALAVLGTDPMIKKEYNWTMIFNLKHFMRK